MGIPRVDCVVCCSGCPDEPVWSAVQDYALQSYPLSRRRLVVQGARKGLREALAQWADAHQETVFFEDVDGPFLKLPSDPVASDVVVPWDPRCRHYHRRVESQVGYLTVLGGPMVCAPDSVLLDDRDGSVYVLDATAAKRCVGTAGGLPETLIFWRDSWPTGKRLVRSYRDLYEALAGVAGAGRRLVTPGLADRLATVVRLRGPRGAGDDLQFAATVRDQCLDGPSVVRLSEFLAFVLARMGLEEGQTLVLKGQDGLPLAKLKAPSTGLVSPTHDV